VRAERQVKELPRGQTIERVVCHHDAAQSYALFLPTNYTSNKKWPIIYSFDPGARGRVPVELFKTAAEKYGYIVVGSNNSRNGIPIRNIIETLWADTHERFSIDGKRVYASGFSGGARVAIIFGYAYEDAVAGVIACSGGFPQSVTPTKEMPFVLFGTTGTDDFNFPEMKNLKRTLNTLGVANRLVVFNGGHIWLPEAVCTEAIEWLELQAMRIGRVVKNESFIEKSLTESLAKARAAEVAQEFYNAYTMYADLAADFKGLADVSDFEKKATALKNSKEVRDYLKREKSLEDKQAVLAQQFDRIIATLNNLSERTDAFADLKIRIGELRKKSEAPQDSDERKLARRTLQGLLVGSFEQASNLSAQKKYAAAATLFEVATEIKPDNADLLYSLASARAASGDKAKALDALAKALANGFTDFTRIEQDENFSALRQNTRFGKIINSARDKK
jgi:dienelactone hydrolase